MIERRYLLPGLLLLASTIFAIKLFFIQILDNTYKQAARSNFTERIKESAYRGRVFDREGRLLVYNVPVYDIYVIPKEVKVLDTATFCQLFGIERTVLRDRLRTARSYSLIRPSKVLGPLYDKEFAQVQGYLRDFRGFYAQSRTIRSYRYPSLAHALGYVAELSKEDLKKDTSNYYQIGDMKGITGIEAYYEKYLRGEPSRRYKMVNARGREIGAFAGGKYDTLSVPGKDLRLGIDIVLQSYAEQLMAGRTGSIVALEPSTGEILCFVSSPNYSPHLLSGRSFTKHFLSLVENELRPLFNRPLQAMYRPGSIFKVAQALVALQEQVITPASVFSCNQEIIGCHNHYPQENLVGAIKNSCNPYFFKVMQRVIQPEGRRQNVYRQARQNFHLWKERMHDLGFGVHLPVDVPFVQRGSVPSLQYYDKIYGALQWKYSNIYSLSIGEGENLVVPIQMANFAAIMANLGYYYVPHFVQSIGNSEGPLHTYRKKYYVSIDAEHFEIVAQAMQLVVESGTGRRARLPDINVSGKTGSVQNKGRPDHSVFIAFAPSEAPKIALSVYVEHAGEGGTIAAAIAGLLIEKYLKGKKAKLQMEPYVFSFLPQPAPNYER